MPLEPRPAGSGRVKSRGVVCGVLPPAAPQPRLRQAQLPLPRRPARPARSLRRMDPQDRRQDRHPPPHPAELTAWQPLFDNARKIRALLAELQDLTLEIIETEPRQEQ